jgi:glycolate oxidase
MTMAALNFTALADRLADRASLVTDLRGYDDYFHDATDEHGQPSAILFARTEADVIAAAKFCRANRIPLVPRGAGTGLSGGCVPCDGSLVVSTERMKMLALDPGRRLAKVGPGVITKDLQDEAEKLGLTYPPDPASYDESTVGGNVAENAGGLRCRRFGVTRDYVIGLKAVTIGGEVVRTGEYGDSSGFALGDVFVGSEGTLVIITEIAVRLINTPAAGDTILVAFDNPRNAAQTVADITRAGIIPTVMEYLDGDAAECSNRYEKTEGLDNAAAILLFETPPENRQFCTQTVESFCRGNNCSYIRAENEPRKVEQLWKVRRNLSKAVKEMAPVRVSEDVAVPNSHFPVLVDFVSKQNQSSPLRINAFGHAGDGNLHVNFLSTPESGPNSDLMAQEVEKLLRKTLALQGTLSGEHGIGLAKRHYLPVEFDRATLACMADLKSVLDPDNLLNPGKIFLKNQKI